jgi:hypothetical protein
LTIKRHPKSDQETQEVFKKTPAKDDLGDVVNFANYLFEAVLDNFGIIQHLMDN